MGAAAPKDKKTGMRAMWPLTMLQAQTIVDEVRSKMPKAVLDVACINSPTQVVLSGDVDAMDMVKSLLDQYGPLGDSEVKVHQRALDVPAPFHSAYMTVPSELMLLVAEELPAKVCTPPIVSGFEGQVSLQTPYGFADTFVPLTNKTVNFVAALQQARSMVMTQPSPVEEPIWIEVGPKPHLSPFIKETFPGDKVHQLCTAEDIKRLLNNKDLVEKLRIGNITRF